MLSKRGRKIRMSATAAVVGLLILGTFWGQDDHFPFGPFRMFSTRNSLEGRVNTARLELTFANGEIVPAEITADDVGLRRAEVEGQKDRFEARPQLLRNLADTYERLHPEEPPIVRVRLVDVVLRLRGGRPHGEPAEQILATWER